MPQVEPAVSARGGLSCATLHASLRDSDSEPESGETRVWRGLGGLWRLAVRSWQGAIEQPQAKRPPRPGLASAHSSSRYGRGTGGSWARAPYSESPGTVSDRGPGRASIVAQDGGAMRMSGRLGLGFSFE